METVYLNRNYDFYNLSEPERIALIGKCFKTKEEAGKYESTYFPIDLENEWINYGKKQGAIRVSAIMPFINKTKEKDTWFRVGVFSPDDLDMDLDFMGAQYEPLREKILDFLHNMEKQNLDYELILQIIQLEFKAGIFT